MPAPAKLGILAAVNVALSQRAREVGYAAEIEVIAAALSGNQGVQGVVKVVVPLRVQPIATLLACAHEAGVIQVAFGYQEHLPVTLVPEALHRDRQQLQK